MHVAGAVHVGPLSGPGILLSGGRGGFGYTMHRDSRRARSSVERPGTKRVDARRVKSGGCDGAPSASTSTSTGASPFPSPERAFSQGCGNPTFESVRRPDRLVVDDGARDANDDVQRRDDSSHRIALYPHDELRRVGAHPTGQERQRRRRARRDSVDRHGWHPSKPRSSAAAHVGEPGSSGRARLRVCHPVLPLVGDAGPTWRASPRFPRIRAWPDACIRSLGAKGASTGEERE